MAGPALNGCAFLVKQQLAGGHEDTTCQQVGMVAVWRLLRCWEAKRCSCSDLQMPDRWVPVSTCQPHP